MISHSAISMPVIAPPDATTADEFLPAMTKFANDDCWGTLSCMVLIHPQSEREHRAVGAALAERRAAALVAVEGDARLYVEPARSAGMDAEFATDAEAAVPLVLSRVRPGDVVLVKASRGVRAERIVAALEGGAT